MNELISCGFQIARVIEPEPPECWRSMCPDRLRGNLLILHIPKADRI